MTQGIKTACEFELFVLLYEGGRAIRLKWIYSKCQGDMSSSPPCSALVELFMMLIHLADPSCQATEKLGQKPDPRVQIVADSLRCLRAPWHGGSRRHPDSHGIGCHDPAVLHLTNKILCEAMDVAVNNDGYLLFLDANEVFDTYVASPNLASFGGAQLAKNGSCLFRDASELSNAAPQS